LAAGQVAEIVKAKKWIPEGNHVFTVRPIHVNRIGDIIEMMQIPGAARRYPPQMVECQQVSDPALGLLVPSASDRPGTYKYPGAKSPILVLGDSFCRIYQYAEPQSLGALAEDQTAGNTGPKGTSTAKKLLPGSAGFISHLALALKMPVDAIVSDGGASTDVRKRLSMNPEILEGKKVVIWEFVERDIGLGRDGWEDVPLPPKLD
jgi:hypothetical protein